MDKRPSTREVARIAGVSAATVSRVFNRQTGVNPELTLKVQAAARQLGYAQGAGAARSTALSPGRQVGITFHGRLGSLASDVFYGEVLLGIESVLREANCAPVLSSRDLTAGSDALPDTRGLQGLILVGADSPEPLVRELGRRLPVVLVDRQLPGTDSVASDNRGGAEMVTNYLRSQGYRSLAFVCESLQDPSFFARSQGFREALAAEPQLPSLIRAVGYGWQAAPQAMADILEQLPAPIGLVAANDATAIQCLSLVRAMGRRVPDEVGLVGFDDIAVSAETIPPLTTVRVPRKELGRLAARRLLERVEQPNLPAIAVTLWVDLVIRESARLL